MLKRQPEAGAAARASICARFPGSQFTPDAVYWLGRLSEEGGRSGRWRAATTRNCRNVFRRIILPHAARRLNALGDGPRPNKSDGAGRDSARVSRIARLGDTIPAAAADRQARADALRSIGFDASAELELRAGYAATGEARLLLEAARGSAEHARTHSARRSSPCARFTRSSNARAVRRKSASRGLAGRLCACPSNLRFVALVERQADVEPMLSRRADSPGVGLRARGAIARRTLSGLMQLLPQTARRFAKQVKVRYSQARARQAGLQYSLGTIYFAGLVAQFRQRFNLRSLPTMPEKIAWLAWTARGRPIVSRPNLWIPFLSRKRASTWKSFLATRKFIVSYTGRNPCEARRMNPVK